jgi:hypothetical protein
MTPQISMDCEGIEGPVPITKCAMLNGACARLGGGPVNG